MSEDVEAVEDEVVKKLNECADFLMVCEIDNKHCDRDCSRKNKEDCLIFIRSVLASLCRIEVARITPKTRAIEEKMYI